MEDYDLEIDGIGRLIDERGGEESDDGGGDVVYRESEEEGEGDGTEDEEDDDEATLGSASRGRGSSTRWKETGRTSPSTNQHRRLDMGRVANARIRTPGYSRKWSQASS